LEKERGKVLKFTATDCECLKHNLTFCTSKTEMIFTKYLWQGILILLAIILEIVPVAKVEKEVGISIKAMKE